MGVRYINRCRKCYDKGIFRTSSSNLDGVRGIGFILPPKTTVILAEIFEIMAFKSIDLKATKDGLPEVWGTSEVSPLITQAYCLKRVSRPRYKGGKPGGSQ